MTPKLTLTGPLRYRLRTAAALTRSAAAVYARRAAKGPKLPGWNFAFELCTHVLRTDLQAAFKMNVAEARRQLEAAVMESPGSSQVRTDDIQNQTFRGTWFEPRVGFGDGRLLYLHGGGYAFYPKAAYSNFIAQIALAAKLRTFALDYRLAPEHKFPAQLEDAFRAYRWLLDNANDPQKLVVAGDSAGGNLAIALLLRVRDSGLPLPSLAVAMSPATEFDRIRPSILENEEFDWIDVRMLARFAAWFCEPEQLSDPMVSPIYSDLRHLPPIYIQAGRREVLFDSIQAFAERARGQGANVTLDVWEDMNHCFQCFADYAPQSREALAKIGTIIGRHMAGVSGAKAFSSR